MLAAVSNDRQATTSGDERSAAWWSLTKTMLAAACFRLAEEGYIDLTAQIDRQPFTLLQLLRNVAGVPNYTDLEAYRAAVAGGESPCSDDELLERVEVSKLRFAPGTRWGYSNTGYLLVRRTIEAVCDRSIKDALQQLVIDPIGLERTRIAVSRDDLTDCFWLSDAGYDPGWVYHRMAVGPPTEAVRFLDAILKHGFLGKASLAELTRRSELGKGPKGRPWDTIGYGCGLMTGIAVDGQLALGHSGVGEQSVAACYHFPEQINRPTVCVFAEGGDEAFAEWEVCRLAAVSA